jgi:hypothetical protein
MERETLHEQCAVHMTTADLKHSCQVESKLFDVAVGKLVQTMLLASVERKSSCVCDMHSMKFKQFLCFKHAAAAAA